MADRQGNTALILASELRHINVVQTLLDHKAKIEAKNK